MTGATVVRTRFAPSPTGYLHIGGVRTALFNWLFARGQGGQFILRIDDTDHERNLAEALRPILDGFRWLGIDWDEGADVGGPHGPYYQSQRQERYRAAVAQLIDRNVAYWDYATTDELQAERAAAQTKGERFVYSRRFMAESAGDRERFAAQGRPGVVRLKMPREGACRFDDRIRGAMSIEWAGEQDHVIQRADGSCLYNLASVVDDFDMAISHVIRAEEHLSNTPRQIFIAEGLGVTPPEYAHLPFVAEPGSRNKLSKRKLDQYLKHADFAKLYERGRAIAAATGLEVSAETFNPVIVDFYRQIGYLPEALLNYLLLLGWSLDDHTESFDRVAMIAHFTLERVNHAPASFDPKKLAAFQARHMAALPLETRVELVLPFLQRAGAIAATPSPETLELVRGIVHAAGDRVQMAGDILDYTDFFVADEALEWDAAAFDKWIVGDAEAAGRLARFAARLQALPAFEPAELEAELQRFVADESIKPGKIVQALRVAVTGRAVGFGLFDALALLGRERCAARITRALARCTRYA